MSSADRILYALFFLYDRCGEKEPTKKRVATMANVKMSSLPSVLTRKLKEPGWIEYGSQKGTIKLTKSGLDRAASLVPPSDMVTTNQQARDEIKKKLKGKALQIFCFLEDGEEHEKTQVMEGIGCTNKNTFNPIVSRDLRKWEYVEYPSKTTIRLNPAVCFPFKED